MGVGVERGRGILKGLAFECLEYAKIAVPAGGRKRKWFAGVPFLL